MAEATAIADISAQDIQEWGEPSSEATVVALRALSQQILTIFKERQGQSSSLAIDANLVSGLASLVEKEIPFFHQGAGVATLPRQIEHLARLRPALTDPVSAETRREIMRGLDCKLATVILGYALRALADLSGQAVNIDLMTWGNSAHPSLIVEAGESAFKVDFETRRDSSYVAEQGRKIIAPAIFREHTESVVSVKKLTKEESARYQAAPFVKRDLGLERLRQLDINFLNS